jgi:hypothetical protein
MKSQFDLHAVPHAGGVSVMACDDRRHVHFVLFDEHDREPMMQFTVTPDETRRHGGDR